MRHRINKRKLGRTSEHREAMLRNLVLGLFEHDRVITTLPKAKEARRLAERCITIAKKGNAAFAKVDEQLPPLREEVAVLKQKLATAASDEEKLELRKQIDRVGGKMAGMRAPGEHYRRQALAKLHHKWIVKKLFEEIAPRYDERPGGYTRILKAGHRLGDGATKALFELV
ncbi:MAG: bL17 family ribosomal protein [Planctomycetota bacterium]